MFPDNAEYERSSILTRLAGADAPGTIARSILEQGQQQLQDRFMHVPIRDLVHARARLVDEVLCAAWQFFELEQIAETALVAVGGYGRGELHPCSDIDLLILCAQRPEGLDGHRIEAFITFLWDLGPDIGHSVRSLEDCISLAADDITVATNIMEARTLAGPDQLLEHLTQATAPDRLWPPAEFFAAKWKEQLARHQKFNNTEYNLEPDVKRAPGGLRDIQMVGWVAKRHFGTDTIEQLVTRGFLTSNEYQIIRRCQDHLWEIRWALHSVTQRNENRLLFDYQKQVAALLGHRGDAGNLAVEKFMRDYYRAALAVSVFNEILLQLFDEVILQKDKPQKVRPLSRHFQVRNDYLEITHDLVFIEHPGSLLEMFLLLSQNPDIRGIRAATVRQVIEQRKLIDAKFRADPENNSLFMQLLRSPHALFTQLRRMKRYGILGQYLPEFGRIIGLMQYDLFHIYTVDAHILLVLKNMRVMRHQDTRKQFPLACDVFYRLPKPELLYIAAIYHDIAKGRGGDHSALGAKDALAFCERHNMSRKDAQLIAWLVRNHLLMSVTAQRKDISDPTIVHDFARQMNNLVHLDYLYVLTVADINATNPSLWNSWRASLLRQLYMETRRALRRGLENPPDRQEWIDETRTEALQLLEPLGLPRERIEQLWARIGDEYFLRENARDIAWHTEALLNHTATDKPLVVIGESTSGPHAQGTQIFVYTPDAENLFAAIVNALDHLNLTIMDARIITSADGFSLDTFIVLDEQGTPIGDDPVRVQAIHEALIQSLQDPEQYRDLLQRHMPRRHKHFSVPTQVVISNNIASGRTLIEIQTLDRPGLLARIGRIFGDFKLQVHNARIATLGEKAEDMFFVTDDQNQPISDPALCEQITRRLIDGLDYKSTADTLA